MKKLRKSVAVAIIVALIAAVWMLWPKAAAQQLADPIVEETVAEITVSIADRLGDFLQSKNSPLASDAEFIVTLKHWKLLIAVSAIESQFCKRQLSYNCWGIGGDSAFRHYSSFRSAVQDANDFIEIWQQKGRWLTVEDMNCSFVVPCSPNWVRVVNSTLEDLNEL